MKDINKPTTLQNNGLILQLTPPKYPINPGLLVMLHGWTGDETSMNIFTRVIPGDRWILAPRGLIPTGEEGYGWIPHRPGWDATLEVFLEVVEHLRPAIAGWIQQLEIAPHPIDILGFSQGAALGLAYALKYPNELGRLACISGFLPYMNKPYNPPAQIRNTKFFIAHGIKDEIVGIDRALEIDQYLKPFGVNPIFCQDNVGHRISASCFNKLGEFFRKKPL